MAVATVELVWALRETAGRLMRDEAVYRWGSFAHCNCGHLVQTITGFAPGAIEMRAKRGEGDWGSQALEAVGPGRPWFDYGDRPALDEGAWEPYDAGACQVTGAPLDEVFRQMNALGLSPDDVGHLERLSDPRVRRRLGTSTKRYAHHTKQNVVDYLHAWADLIEEDVILDGSNVGFLEAAE